MNETIKQYFDSIEVRLIESPAVVSYQLIRKDVSFTDGKIRIKAILLNTDILEVFIYAIDLNRLLVMDKYSFHWQDREGKLLLRMDNAPHFPELPNAPHHVHKGDKEVADISEPPDFMVFINSVERAVL